MFIRRNEDGVVIFILEDDELGEELLKSLSVNIQKLVTDGQKGIALNVYSVESLGEEAISRLNKMIEDFRKQGAVVKCYNPQDDMMDKWKEAGFNEQDLSSNRKTIAQRIKLALRKL